MSVRLLEILCMDIQVQNLSRQHNCRVTQLTHVLPSHDNTHTQQCMTPRRVSRPAVHRKKGPKQDLNNR